MKDILHIYGLLISKLDYNCFTMTFYFVVYLLPCLFKEKLTLWAHNATKCLKYMGQYIIISFLQLTFSQMSPGSYVT